MLHIAAEIKWPLFRSRHVQINFLEWKLFYFDSDVNENCSQGFNQQWSSIDSDNGFAPIRRQTITLRWRHNGCDSVSNDQPRECLLRRAHQRKHQSSASLAFVRGIHRRPVNSPHKWPVTRKMFPFDDVIMIWTNGGLVYWRIYASLGCNELPVDHQSL